MTATTRDLVRHATGRTIAWTARHTAAQRLVGGFGPAVTAAQRTITATSELTGTASSTGQVPVATVTVSPRRERRARSHSTADGDNHGCWWQHTDWSSVTWTSGNTAVQPSLRPDLTAVSAAQQQLRRRSKASPERRPLLLTAPAAAAGRDFVATGAAQWYVDAATQLGHVNRTGSGTVIDP